MPLSDPQLFVDGAARRRRRMTAWLIGADLTVALVLGALVAHVLHTSHRAYAAQARDVSEGLAAVAQLNVSAEMGHVDAILRATAGEMERLLDVPDAVHGAAPGAVPGAAPDAVLNEVLHARFKLLHGIDAFRAADAAGVVRWGTQLPAGAPARITDRDYFIAARDLSKPVTQVSGPLVSRVSGRWVIGFGRPLVVRERFAGFLYVTVGVDHFRHLFERYDLAPLDAMTLRRDDLRLVARMAPGSPSQGQVGDTQVTDKLREMLAAQPRQGTFVSIVPFDGQDRTTAYRALDDWPFVVYAGVNNDRFFLPWRQQAWTVASLAALAWLLVALATWQVHRATRRQDRAMQALAEQGRRIQALQHEQSAMLDSDLVGMARIARRTITWRNRAVERLLGYGPGELQDMPARVFYWDDEQYEEVGRQVYTAVAEHGYYRSQIRMRSKTGEAVWVDFGAVPLSDTEVFAMAVDITAMKAAHEDLAHAAFHDALTQLPNRVLLYDRIEQALAMARRERKQVAVCYVDLDGFKAVNDAQGHDAGDQLLQTVAARLTASIRPLDTAARLGGDEFVLVLTCVEDGEWRAVLARVVDAIGELIVLSSGATVTVGVTVGVAVFSPDDAAGAHELIERADHEMLRGKRDGKGRVRAG
ncbi:diguanylate cyclase domain-containing protein [Roseateles sp.]|uniref:diguanylate cyclase domain-containing protein n=1 Tax=Roseateles sp. TaxID=1971397 RepID=UPI002F426008